MNSNMTFALTILQNNVVVKLVGNIGKEMESGRTPVSLSTDLSKAASVKLLIHYHLTSYYIG